MLTSDTSGTLRELPQRLVVLGGGPIGCELAQAFARFGSKVTQVEMLPRLLAREDPEVSEMVRGALRARKASTCSPATARSRVREDAQVLVCEHDGREKRVEFDALLCAVGRDAEHRRLRARGARHPGDRGAHRRDQRVPADALPEHLRLRRRRRPLPVHAHRVAPGVVRGGQRAVRRLAQVPRRLLGDSVGHVHRSGGRARRPERDRGARRRTFAYEVTRLRHRRSRPRDRRRSGARLGQGAHRARARTASSAPPSSASTPAS